MTANSTFPADEEKAKDTCSSYEGIALWAYAMNSCLGYVIVGVNYVIRTVAIMLLSWIGYASETE